MAVTHDRYFLDDVAEWICEVDRGSSIPMRAIIQRIWRIRPHDLKHKISKMPNVPRKCGQSWIGSARLPKPAKQRTVHDLIATSRWKQRPVRKKLDFTEIQIPVGPRLGQKSWTPVIYIRRLAIVCLSTIFPLATCAMVSLVLLALTAWGKSTLFKMGQEPLIPVHFEVGGIRSSCPMT